MRLIQFLSPTGEPVVALVESVDRVQALAGVASVRQLALRAVERSRSLADYVPGLLAGEAFAYEDILKSGRLLAPINHPDPAHLLVSGTGLTHLGSADTRDEMHADLEPAAPQNETDSMKIFRLGVEGGKPPAGRLGAQPEWFYKGDGGIVVAPGQPLVAPAFTLDGGEEPELAAIYVVFNAVMKGKQEQAEFDYGDRYCDLNGDGDHGDAGEREEGCGADGPVTLGRRNYLFAGSDEGGERAAAIHTLIGTAKLNGLDPQAYLSHVLERIAAHPVNRIDELLPWNFASDLVQPRDIAA